MGVCFTKGSKELEVGDLYLVSDSKSFYIIWHFVDNSADHNFTLRSPEQTILPEVEDLVLPNA